VLGLIVLIGIMVANIDQMAADGNIGAFFNGLKIGLLLLG
jgi:hypothetical protein